MSAMCMLEAQTTRSIAAGAQSQVLQRARAPIAEPVAISIASLASFSKSIALG
jgi:hypothetical protein